VLQRSLPLLAEEKYASIGSEYFFPPNRGRNLRPDEHVSLPTLCESEEKYLLNVRRWQGRSFSVAESFGAGAALQCCLVTRHLASHWLHGLMICTQLCIILIFKLPREHICRGLKKIILIIIMCCSEVCGGEETRSTSDTCWQTAFEQIGRTTCRCFVCAEWKTTDTKTSLSPTVARQFTTF